MSEAMVYIPFPQELYNDIVRFSEGGVDPVWLARFRVERWVEDNCSPVTGEPEIWGDHLVDVADKYAPGALEAWQELVGDTKPPHSKPLVWKEVTVPSGSDVRMHYSRDYQYAKVADGRIVDGDQRYTPNEWASKVANGTSRNAWDALWFREPKASHWTSASALREQARQRARGADDA